MVADVASAGPTDAQKATSDVAANRTKRLGFIAMISLLMENGEGGMGRPKPSRTTVNG